MKHRRAARAFTILEVMFAIAIFAIGLSGTLTGFNIIREKVQHQRQLAAATQVAASWMEQIVILPRASHHLDLGAHGPRNYTLDGGVVAAPSYFTLNWTVIADDPRPPMKGVTTTVAWTSAGVNHQVTLLTYVD